LFRGVLDNSEYCNVRSGIGQLRIMFGVVLDNPKKCSELSNTTPNKFYQSSLFFSEWYWITPKNVQRGIGQLGKLFGVVLDNSEKCSEWYWTTRKIFRSCPIPLRTLFGVVQYHSEHFSDLSNITSLADPYWFLIGSGWIRICLHTDPDSDPPEWFLQVCRMAANGHNPKLPFGPPQGPAGQVGCCIPRPTSSADPAASSSGLLVCPRAFMKRTLGLSLYTHNVSPLPYRRLLGRSSHDQHPATGGGHRGLQGSGAGGATVIIQK